MLVMCTLLRYYCPLLLISTIFIFACYCMLYKTYYYNVITYFYIVITCYYINHYYLLLQIHYYLLLHHYYVIITSLLPHYAILKIHVIMDSLLQVITLACSLLLHHYYPLCHYFPLLPIMDGATWG